MDRFQFTDLSPDDAADCAALFYRAVREGAGAHYDAAQRAAWAPAPPDPARWAPRLAAQFGVTARRDGQLAGFFTMTSDGHLDLAFVAPETMGSGLAGQLYARLETQARRRGLDRLTCDASHFARPFLERRGWHVETPQRVQRQGVEIENFRMAVRLSLSGPAA